MKCKNLETGVIANQGDKFLAMQSKPYISKAGKYYPDGVWVEYKAPAKSEAAAKIIDQAKEPAPVQAPKAAPTVVADKPVV